MRLRQVERQEGASGPGDYKGRKFDNGKGEKFPWRPEIDGNALDWVCVRLEEPELLLRGRAPAKERISLGRSGVGKVSRLTRWTGLLEIRGYGQVDDDFLLGRRARRPSSDFHLVGVDTVPSCLREAEKHHNQSSAEHGHVEPPEVAPSGIIGHRTSDNGTNLGLLAGSTAFVQGGSTDHQRSKIERKIQRVVLSSVVKEHHIRNDCRLDGLIAS